jgi:hypothetical protein
MPPWAWIPLRLLPAPAVCARCSSRPDKSGAHCRGDDLRNAADGGALRRKLGLEGGASGGTWCHGSAGYLWCMLRAFGDHPALRASIDWAVRALLDTPLLANPGYCHGMAGQLDVWSTLAQYPRLADMSGRGAALAAQLLEQLGVRAENGWAWPADEPDQIRPALWSGTLGPACALALFQRGKRDTLFSRQTLARIFAPQ